MGEQRAERIEAAVDRVAAALFALATGCAGYLLGGVFHISALLAGATVLFVSYGATASLLHKVPVRTAPFEIPTFEVSAFPELEPELEELLLTEYPELVLTDGDRLAPPRTESADELMLDDILARIGPGARVVRLFDPLAMPTPGQLKSRIDKHLQRETTTGSPDASHALHEALAELRRSLG